MGNDEWAAAADWRGRVAALVVCWAENISHASAWAGLAGWNGSARLPLSTSSK